MDAYPLSTDDIVDLRWLALDDIAGSAWPALHDWLDPGEQAKAAGFRFEGDRKAYVAAHALARSMLASRLGCPRAALRFAIGLYGKPELAMTPGAAPVRFSLSHTRGLVAVAVTGRHAVGVDAEAIIPDRLDPDPASRIFAPAEAALLRRLAPAAATDAAFAFWTLKEAYTKAIGLGLNHPFDTLTFTLDPLAVQPPPGSGEDAARWLLRSLRPTPAHALALALRHPRPAAVRVDSRAIRPDELAPARGAA